MGAGGPGFAPDPQSMTGATSLAETVGPDAMAMTESDASMQASAASQDSTETMVAALDAAEPGTTSIDALNRGITQSSDIQPVANLYSTGPAAAESPEATEDAPVVLPANAPIPTEAPAGQQTVASVEPEPEPAPVALAVVAPPKKQSIFARLFSAKPTPPKKIPNTRRTATSPRQQVQIASVAGDNTLPGVRASALFEINSGTDEDGENGSGVEYASAGGLARLSPNGLHLQTEKVDVACLKPGLVRVLRTIENHYGRDVIVTSGFRSPTHNRRIGGATGSKHTSCEAADIQVDGVTKWQLAKYVRSMPGRGGVGTYCHTNSVHVDIGSERDWNWRCRRRK